MQSAFDLRFDPILPASDTTLANPPSLRLCAPEAGWIRWRIGDEEPLVIGMSSVYSPLASVWAWAMATGEQLMPVTLRIDEEGVYSELCAEDGGGGMLRLTVRQTDSEGREYRRLAWYEEPLDWLDKLAETFCDFFETLVDASEWCIGADAFWPEIAGELPWCWPVSVATQALAHATDWSAKEHRSWFFLKLTALLHPLALRLAGCPDPDDQVDFARLQLQFALARREALNGAMGALLGEQPGQALLESSAAEHLFRSRLQDAWDWFAVVDDESQWVEPPLAIRCAARCRAMEAFNLAGAVESALYALHDTTVRPRFECLPLAEGQWFGDLRGFPGRVLSSHGARLVIDWGKVGISAISVAAYRLFAHAWLRPIRAPRVFNFPDTPLFQRWRSFATLAQTTDLAICPCCGYPSLEDEPIEIADCALCGWPLYLALDRLLPDPDQPLRIDPLSGTAVMPSLRESRRWFEHHGDAYAPTDTENTIWLRRPDVVVLKRKVIEGFDAWLADPSHQPDLFPEDDFQKLDWMPRASVD